ncbi:MAG TPA: histidinol dehydrogenase [Deltaproteobacteria bacterium]|nr:histidinol dehydrogenase [Deltaproteobacteria bacterium]HPR53924.1 histidinol dehydrogenase [Deltaproteobacteria bacterium]HXK46724.1 histidinol dehydrogenase [Deltaproteobacteria bacterium]
MNTIRTADPGWKEKLKHLLDRMRTIPSDVDSSVRQIIEQVRIRGDAALFDYTRTYDGYDPHRDGLFIGPVEIEQAYRAAPRDIVEALGIAAGRIEAFHAHQKEQSWFITDETGTILGQKVTPVNSAGIYIPGGANAFPSTVLMNVIPAKIAGVKHIVVVSPTPAGRVSQALLAAAHVAGVERICRIGGAQAIAALAYGTERIPRVDKVVGPGNIYVAHAKRLLQGIIGIDAFAGPSEILVIADEGADPNIVAHDLLSQAEHDVQASSILVTPSFKLAQSTLKALEEAIEPLPRRDTVRKSLENHGACIVVRDLEEAVAIANEVAPEHLELMFKDSWEYLGKIVNAGAVFLGYATPEAIGDYVAGPNHTLPTGSTARFYSPLGVYDFTKRTSVIGVTGQALNTLGPVAVRIARSEDLEAHARSVECRLGKQDP